MRKVIDRDALVTAVEAAASPALKGVCRHLIGMWKTKGKLQVKGKRGRSPLFRYGDILQVEQRTRASGNSHRLDDCASCQRSTRKAEPLAA